MKGDGRYLVEQDVDKDVGDYGDGRALCSESHSHDFRYIDVVDRVVAERITIRDQHLVHSIVRGDKGRLT